MGAQRDEIEENMRQDSKKKNGNHSAMKTGKENRADVGCPYAKKCGGCDYQGMEYREQLSKKQNYMK